MRDLRHTLLKAGVSPSATNRYLEELADHRQDIITDLTEAGWSKSEAAQEAENRLGSVDTLAYPMITDPRFRSFVAKAPLLAWLGLPVLVQIVLVASLAALIVFGTRIGAPFDLTTSAASVILTVAPIAIAWLVLHNANRRHAALTWPLIGMTVSVLLGATLHLHTSASDLSVSLSTPDLFELTLYALLAPIPLLHRKTRIV